MRKRKNRYMSKADFDQMFKEEYIPMILRIEMKQGSTFPDAPLRRETYNNAIDSFSQDGQISSSQAFNWSHPSWLETYGFRKALAEKRKRDRYGYSNPRKKSNPRKRRNGYQYDDDGIREVLLTVENDHGFYEMVLKPTAKNMAIKQYKGKFNKTKALKMYKHVADKADKFYAWTYGDRSKGALYWLSQKGFMLRPQDRHKLAAELLDSSMDLIEGYVKDLKSGVKQRSLKNPRKRRNSRRRR